MGREEAFIYLRDHPDLHDPVPFGRGKPFYERFGEDEQFVVYTDEYAHRGEGKHLVDYKTAVEAYPDCLASRYIYIDPPSTLRYLYLGRHLFLLEYRSDHKWQSNCGSNVEVELMFHVQFHSCVVKEYPLCAIDVVYPFNPEEVELYAVDVNTAPQLRGTGIEDCLSGKEVVNIIKSWYDCFGSEDI